MMKFVKELQEKRNQAAIDLAKRFVEQVKPNLIASAEKGYGGYEYKINTDNTEEKEKLPMYENSVFVEYLNNNLGGVTVEFTSRYQENLVFKGRGWTTFCLIFTWK